MAHVISIVSDPKKRPAIKINFDFGAFEPALPETVCNELVSHLRTRWIQSLETAKWLEANPDGRHESLSDGMTVNVKELLEERAVKTRQEVTKVEKTAKLAEGMDLEDLEDLMRRLEEMKGKLA